MVTPTSVMSWVMESSNITRTSTSSGISSPKRREAHITAHDVAQTTLMNAASEYNVDYFDALTDLEEYIHYGEALEE